MKNIIFAILTSLVLFGASAATSYYLNQPPETEEEDEAPEEVKSPLALDEPPSAIEQVAQMPVGIRPDQAQTIAAVLQMNESAQQRQAKLDQRAEELNKEEKRVKLLYEDLIREKDELLAFSEGVEAKVAALDKMTVRLQEVLTAVSNKKGELVALEKKTGLEAEKSQHVKSRVEEVKGWFQSIEPQQGAEYMKSWAENGELDLAVALLQTMPERQATKIINALDDPALIKQLIFSVRVKPKQETK